MTPQHYSTGDDFKGLLTTDYEVVHLCRVHTCCHLRISAGVYGQKQMRCHTYWYILMYTDIYWYTAIGNKVESSLGQKKQKTCLPMPPATSLGPLRTTTVCRGDADVPKPLQVTPLLLVTSPFSVDNICWLSMPKLRCAASESIEHLFEGTRYRPAVCIHLKCIKMFTKCPTKTIKTTRPIHRLVYSNVVMFGI